MQVGMRDTGCLESCVSHRMVGLGWHVLGGDLEGREQRNMVGRGVESWMGRDGMQVPERGGMWGGMLGGMCGAPAMRYTG